jgi:hypothetical protein
VEAALNVLGALLALLGLYLADKGISNRTARIQAEALRDAEKTRRIALEAAADAERRARELELDAEIAEVRTPDDAIRLRDELSRNRANRNL